MAKGEGLTGVIGVVPRMLLVSRKGDDDGQPARPSPGPVELDVLGPAADHRSALREEEVNFSRRTGPRTQMLAQSRRDNDRTMAQKIRVAHSDFTFVPLA